jgi:hypothetical protein
MVHARDTRFHTTAEALEACVTAGALKKLAGLLGPHGLTRKAELVAHLAGQLLGDGAPIAWESLSELQRAAVAEVVHGPSPLFDAERFRAKYGANPVWGELGDHGRTPPSPLRLFLHGAGVLPDDLKERIRAFVPPPRDVTLASFADLPAGDEASPLTVRETERAAQFDLLAVLRLIDSAKLTASDKTRRPSGATVKAVAEALVGGDFY